MHIFSNLHLPLILLFSIFFLIVQYRDRKQCPFKTGDRGQFVCANFSLILYLSDIHACIHLKIICFSTFSCASCFEWETAFCFYIANKIENSKINKKKNKCKLVNICSIGAEEFGLINAELCL